MSKLNEIKGFTLLELLIAAMLTIIISTAALSFFVRANQQCISQEDISEMQQSLRASIQELVAQTRMAGFNIPDSISAIHIDSVSGNPDTLVIHRDTFEVKFYIDRSTDSLNPCLIKDVNGTAAIFSDEISDLQATWVPPASVRLTLTAKSSKIDNQIKGGQYLTRTETQIINLRNMR